MYRGGNQTHPPMEKHLRLFSRIKKEIERGTDTLTKFPKLPCYAQNISDTAICVLWVAISGVVAGARSTQQPYYRLKILLISVVPISRNLPHNSHWIIT